MDITTPRDDAANTIMDELRLPYLHLDDEDELTSKVLKQIKANASEASYLNEIQTETVNDFLNKIELPILIGDFDDELYTVVWDCIPES